MLVKFIIDLIRLVVLSLCSLYIKKLQNIQTLYSSQARFNILLASGDLTPLKKTGRNQKAIRVGQNNNKKTNNGSTKSRHVHYDEQ